jgi:hypothetical protein
VKQSTAVRNADILIIGGLLLDVVSRQLEGDYHPALTRLLLPVVACFMVLAGASIFRRRCDSQAREIAGLQRPIRTRPDTDDTAEPLAP